MAIAPSRHKSYHLNQSPLYKLKTRRKLAALFNLSVRELETLVKRSDNYRIFTIGKKVNKPRQVEEPKPHLERLHRRLFNLLRRIEPPKYLHSGIKGKSYITNAKKHIGKEALITLDIQKYFPSTKGWHVYDFFHNVMHCNKDVAGLLTKISTHNDHVPTGSCLSQIIAFYAHYEMFQEIYSLTSSLNLSMTCYVDDIAISGKNANKAVLHQIREILRRRGLNSHPSKERVYRAGVPKEVTGSIVIESGLKLPNRKHKKIHEEINLILKMDDTNEKLDRITVTMGRLITASQSDPELRKLIIALDGEKNKVKRKIMKYTRKRNSQNTS